MDLPKAHQMTAVPSNKKDSESPESTSTRLVANDQPRQRPRSRVIAVLLALLASPFFSMLYLGRAVRAFVYLVATVSGFVLASLLASAGLWMAGLPIWLLPVVVKLIGIVDADRIARHYREAFTGPWYSRWYGVSGAWVLLAAILLLTRTFVVEPFNIPSGAMMPTLLVGDHILVDKFSVRVSGELPRRGDVIVFLYPEDPSIPFVKRVVGLPGDRVTYDNKTLYINGQSAEQDLLGYWKDPGPNHAMDGAELRLEAIDDRSYGILIQAEYPSMDGQMVVPPEHYFVLGDNRDNSRDSRYWGTVPTELLIGRVTWIIWNTQLPYRIGPLSPEWGKEEARAVLSLEPPPSSVIGDALDGKSDEDICIGMRYGNQSYLDQANQRGLTKARCSEISN